jgi:hypothetical protein
MADIYTETVHSGQPYSTWVSVMLDVMFRSIDLVFIIFPARI